MRKHNFLKKLSISIASLALVCPLALTSVSANTHARNNNIIIVKNSRHHKVNKHVPAKDVLRNRINHSVKMAKAGKHNHASYKKHARVAKFGSAERAHNKKANLHHTGRNVKRSKVSMTKQEKRDLKSLTSKLTKKEQRQNKKVDKVAKAYRHNKKILNSKNGKHYLKLVKGKKASQIKNKKAHYYFNVNKKLHHERKQIMNLPATDSLNKADMTKFLSKATEFYAYLPKKVNKIAGHNHSKLYRLGIRNALENLFTKKDAKNKAYKAGYIKGSYVLDKPVYNNNRKDMYYAKSGYDVIVKNGPGTGSTVEQLYNNFAQEEFSKLLK